MILTMKKGLKKEDIQSLKDADLLTFIKRRMGSPEANLKHVGNDLGEGKVLHNNYLSYLEMAWKSHYGVILTPDIFWYTLVCEIAEVVKEDPEKYRNLFTTAPSKTEIIVLTDSLTVLPLGTIIDRLKELVPDKFADSFLQGFSTTTERSKFAQYAAFADAVSPFYNYGMYLCGIPFVRLDGEKDDWLKIRKAWGEIVKAFQPKGLVKYFDRVAEIIDGIVGHFGGTGIDFKDMFTLERCGSGGQVEADGWFTRLFRKQPELRCTYNFSTHVSKVNYKNLTTGKNFQMQQGLFMSAVADDMLLPEFGQVIFEVMKP